MFLNKILINSILLFSTVGYAQVAVAPKYDAGVYSAKNYVKNADAEKNDADVIDASSIHSRSTSSPLEGAGSHLIDGSSTSQKVKFTTKNFDSLLANTNCQASFIYGLASTASYYSAYVEDSSGNKMTADLVLTDGTSGSKEAVINFICPSSNYVNVVIESTNASAPAIKVDHIYAGQALNLMQVNQSEHLGTLKYATTANCTWSNAPGGTWTGFAADTDCASPAVTGSLTAAATKIPAFKMVVAAGSKYRITAKGTFYATTTTGYAKFRFHDGTDGSFEAGSAYKTSGNYDTIQDILTAIYEPTTSGLKTIEIQSKDFNTEINNDSSSTGPDLVFEVERFPNQSQMAVNSNAPTSSWSGYFQNSGSPSWNTSSTTFADPSLTGTATLVERTNNGFGTVTAASGSLPGITFTPKLKARYRITVDAQMTGGTSSYAEARLTDGTTTIAENGGIMAPGATLGEVAVSMSGIYEATSTSPVTLKVQLSSPSGSAYIRQATSSQSAPLSFTITEIGGLQNAPILVGSVTSSATGAIKLEGANVDNVNGSSVVNSSTSSWITTSSCSGNGDCTYAIAGFSEAPYCTCSHNYTNAVTCGVYAITSSSVKIVTVNAGGSATVNEPGTKIVCVGAK